MKNDTQDKKNPSKLKLWLTPKRNPQNCKNTKQESQLKFKMKRQDNGKYWDMNVLANTRPSIQVLGVLEFEKEINK